MVKDGDQKHIAADFIIDTSGYGRVIPCMFNLDEPSAFDPSKTRHSLPRFKTPQRYRRKQDYSSGSQATYMDPGHSFSNGITSVGFVAGPEFFRNFPLNANEQMRAC